MTESQTTERGKIGVVTVTYNSTLVLQEFFDSLALQSYKNFVLYLVDNASKDETIKMARERRDISVVILANSDNVGVADGNNQGITAALADGCECVLLLNNDTTFPDDFIAELYKGLELYSCDMTTGKMYFYDRPEILWCAGGRFKSWPSVDVIHDGVNNRDSGQYDNPRRVCYTPTCCLLVRRTVFDRVGMMDGKYFVYYDDGDFLFRCRSHGIVLWYVPKAKLWHKVGSLNKNLPDFSVRYFARNHIYFVRKHLPRWQAYIWYWLDQSRYALAFILRRSSRAKWRIRRVAAREGWTIPLHTKD